MPDPAGIPVAELLRLLMHADRLIEARVLPGPMQAQLQEWTLENIRILLRRIEDESGMTA